MPAPTKNIGDLVTRLNCGPAADIVRPNGEVVHAPRTLSLHSGVFNTTQSGQVIQDKKITGAVRIGHDDVIFINCWFDDASVHITGTFRRKPQLLWCRALSPEGYEDFRDNSSGGIRLSDFLIYRTEVGGYIDLIHPVGGDWMIIESILHSPYHDLASRHQGADSPDAHCDLIQPPGNNPIGWNSGLVQGVKFEAYQFEKGMVAGTKVPRGLATSGLINVEWGQAKNTTIRDSSYEGYASQCLMFQSTHGTVVGTVVVSNHFKKQQAGGPRYAAKGFMNAHQTTFKWGGNLDVETGESITGFYSSPGNSNGNPQDAGSVDQYRTYYVNGRTPAIGDPGGSNPGTTVFPKIESPLDGAVISSGTHVFFGQADPDQDDSNDNYTFWDYLAQNEDVGTVFLDHDRIDSNSGYTFTDVAADGVDVVDRTTNTTKRLYGTTELQLRGIRNDGTNPTEKITVFFGEEEEPPPPPTDIETRFVVEAIVEGEVEFDTNTGGVDKAFVKNLYRLVPVAFKREWYRGDVRDGREVVPVGDDFVYKDQTS